MARFYFSLVLLLLTASVSATMGPELKNRSSSPELSGDTRMGADAVRSGTDLQEQKIQAQEDEQAIPVLPNEPLYNNGSDTAADKKVLKKSH